jgi:hypothetical protein
LTRVTHVESAVSKYSAEVFAAGVAVAGSGCREVVAGPAEIRSKRATASDLRFTMTCAR